MRYFFGILLVSGYCSVPRRQLFWQLQPDTHNEAIAKSIRRGHFDEIMKYFHAANIHFQTSNDKFEKVQPLLDILNTNFSKFGVVLDPANESIDEAKIPYFEPHPSKQFLRGKPIRLRCKAWVAADPKATPHQSYKSMDPILKIVPSIASS
ncbi:unnamed protein product [Lepeophtheirus salmonis]|uniref:(salmon louse) hypothetical protein n=1 Tax=Lepeophtheirus salmonis TaxID=72036 RepID=A0A7R8H4V0_LEPSM|nr:unnamed protein product [Lepeophtheirus salmonis]CAF2869214.1 unnamed protein product [Lepeophtheirus salmonis]